MGRLAADRRELRTGGARTGAGARLLGRLGGAAFGGSAAVHAAVLALIVGGSWSDPPAPLRVVPVTLVTSLPWPSPEPLAATADGVATAARPQPPSAVPPVAISAAAPPPPPESQATGRAEMAPATAPPPATKRPDLDLPEARMPLPAVLRIAADPAPAEAAPPERVEPAIERVVAVSEPVTELVHAVEGQPIGPARVKTETPAATGRRAGLVGAAAGMSGVARALAGNRAPAYPYGARRAGIEGRVVLRVRVGPDGKVAALRIDQSSRHVTLDRAALDAVKTWRFEPARRLGAAIASELRVPVTFRLTE